MMASSLKRRCKSIIDYSNYLPKELWFEIFLRLPLNSIFKFMCVSRLWFSLLSNPFFITRRFKDFNTSLPWTFFYKLDLPVNISVSTVSLDIHSKFVSDHDGFSFKFLYSNLSPNSKQDHIYLLASSNGLVLCSTTRNYQTTYYVCNPLTKKFVSIPQQPHNIHRKWVSNGFVCESSSLSSAVYKVVCIPDFREPLTNFDIEIFSSDLGEWKSFKVSCPQQVTMLHNFSSHVVSCNGVLYWFEGQNRIIAYYLNNNNNNNNTENGGECKLINLPKEITNDCRCLGESEGFINYSQCENGQLSIWVLEDYFNGGWNWHLVHKIELKDMAENCGGSFGNLLSRGSVNLNPLAFNPVDRNVVILGFGALIIFAYNIKTKQIKILNIHHPFYYYLNLQYVPFVLTPRPTKL